MIKESQIENVVVVEVEDDVNWFEGIRPKESLVAVVVVEVEEVNHLLGRVLPGFIWPVKLKK